MPCVVTVAKRDVDSALHITGCQCLDWHQQRVICRHMLVVAIRLLSREGVTVDSHTSADYAIKVGRVWCTLRSTRWCHVPRHRFAFSCCYAHVNS